MEEKEEGETSYEGDENAHHALKQMTGKVNVNWPKTPSNSSQEHPLRVPLFPSLQFAARQQYVRKDIEEEGVKEEKESESNENEGELNGRDEWISSSEFYWFADDMNKQIFFIDDALKITPLSFVPSFPFLSLKELLLSLSSEDYPSFSSSSSSSDYYPASPDLTSSTHKKSIYTSLKRTIQLKVCGHFAHLDCFSKVQQNNHKENNSVSIFCPENDCGMEVQTILPLLGFTQTYFIPKDISNNENFDNEIDEEEKHIIDQPLLFSPVSPGQSVEQILRLEGEKTIEQAHKELLQFFTCLLYNLGSSSNSLHNPVSRSFTTLMNRLKWHNMSEQSDVPYFLCCIHQNIPKPPKKFFTFTSVIECAREASVKLATALENTFKNDLLVSLRNSRDSMRLIEKKVSTSLSTLSSEEARTILCDILYLIGNLDIVAGVSDASSSSSSSSPSPEEAEAARLMNKRNILLKDLTTINIVDTLSSIDWSLRPVLLPFSRPYLDRLIQTSEINKKEEKSENSPSSESSSTSSSSVILQDVQYPLLGDSSSLSSSSEGKRNRKPEDVPEVVNSDTTCLPFWTNQMLEKHNLPVVTKSFVLSVEQQKLISSQMSIAILCEALTAAVIPTPDDNEKSSSLVSITDESLLIEEEVLLMQIMSSAASLIYQLFNIIISGKAHSILNQYKLMDLVGIDNNKPLESLSEREKRIKEGAYRMSTFVGSDPLVLLVRMLCLATVPIFSFSSFIQRCSPTATVEFTGLTAPDFIQKRITEEIEKTNPQNKSELLLRRLTPSIFADAVLLCLSLLPHYKLTNSLLYNPSSLTDDSLSLTYSSDMSDWFDGRNIEVMTQTFLRQASILYLALFEQEHYLKSDYKGTKCHSLINVNIPAPSHYVTAEQEMEEVRVVARSLSKLRVPIFSASDCVNVNDACLVCPSEYSQSENEEELKDNPFTSDADTKKDSKEESEDKKLLSEYHKDVHLLKLTADLDSYSVYASPSSRFLGSLYAILASNDAPLPYGLSAGAGSVYPPGLILRNPLSTPLSLTDFYNHITKKFEEQGIIQNKYDSSIINPSFVLCSSCGMALNINSEKTEGSVMYIAPSLPHLAEQSLGNEEEENNHTEVRIVKVVEGGEMDNRYFHSLICESTMAVSSNTARIEELLPDKDLDSDQSKQPYSNTIEAYPNGTLHIKNYLDLNALNYG